MRSKINLLSSIVFQMSLQLSPLIVFPHLIKTLSVNEFGFYSFFWAIAQYFILIVEYGFNLTSIQEAYKTKNLNKLYSEILYSRLLIFFILFIVFYIGVLFYDVNFNHSILFFGFMLQVLSTVLINQWVFRFYEKIIYLLIPASISLFFIPLLTYFLVEKPTDSYIAALVQGCVSLLSALVAIILIKYKIRLLIVTVKFKDIISCLKRSFSVFIANFSFSIYAVSPPIILGILSTNSEVALFSAASKIRAAGVGIILPISNVLYVTVGKIVNENKLINKIILLYSIMCVFISLGIYLTADSIVDLLMREQYLGVVTLIKMFSIIIFLVCMNTFLSQSILLHNGFKLLYTKISILCCFLYIVISIPLMNNLGAHGAVITIMTIESFSLLTILFYINKFKLLNWS